MNIPKYEHFFMSYKFSMKKVSGMQPSYTVGMQKESLPRF